MFLDVFFQNWFSIDLVQVLNNPNQHLKCYIYSPWEFIQFGLCILHPAIIERFVSLSYLMSTICNFINFLATYIQTFRKFKEFMLHTGLVEPIFDLKLHYNFRLNLH
jgi:hypothetical protein